MNVEQTGQILARAEANCMVLLSLRGLLANSQQDDLARLADFAYGNSSAVAETCGDELEVEARVV